MEHSEPAARGERDPPEPRQSARFLALYALAAAGGSASYAPFLTVVLPLKASALAGPDAVRVLSYVAFAGALAASASNIAFGWLSDRTRNRTGWIVAGLAASCSLLIAMRLVDDIAHLLAMIVLWQISLNMMLNPLSAWAGDCVPDEQKGTLGGLLSLAPGVGALAGALVTVPGLADGNERLVLIAVLVTLLVLPVLLWGRPRPMPHLMIATGTPGGNRVARGNGGGAREATPAVWRMWLARLLLQVAEAALFAFLLLWLTGLDTRVTDSNVATIFALVLLASVPVSIFAGRWSDRAKRPMLPLIVAAASGALGLLAMAAAPGTAWAIAAYCLFGVSAAVFLALHAGQTLRVLPRPEHRGRDLGVFNLTNTIPSLIMPGLTLSLIPLFGFDGLFVVLAVFVAASGLLLLPRRMR